MSDNQADLIVHARWIAPVDPQGTVLENHALVVKDGRIADLLPSALANEKWQSEDQQHLGDHLLIPGLVNAHTHAATDCGVPYQMGHGRRGRRAVPVPVWRRGGIRR